ncbi:MAG: PAS domain S-box protein [Brevundimonas sp.]
MVQLFEGSRTNAARRLVAGMARRGARTPAQAVAIALGATAVVLFIRWALTAFYGEATGFMILLPAVIVASLAGGRLGGLSALLACLLGGWLVVALGDPSVGPFAHTRRVATFNFIVVGLFVTGVASALRSTIRNLDEASAARLEADQRLQVGQAELQAILDQSSAGIARLDVQGRIVAANARFSDILGRSAAELTGQSPAAFTYHEDVAATGALLDRVRETGVGGEVEKRYVRSDGSIVWCLASIRGLADVEGGFSGYVAVLVDLSEARRAEAARLESEARFRLMADTAPSPVWMTDTEARVEFANRALLEFYGQPGDAVLGHVWRASMHPDDVAGVDAIQAERRPTHQPYAFEARFKRADGAWRWMRCSVNPRFGPDGDFLGYVGMSFDLTDQREALAEARESEERFRAIADTAPVLIWVTAKDRSREFVNEAYVRFMGGDYEAVRTANWRDYIHPEDQDRLVAESLAGEATRQPFSLEARYLRHDGEYRWLKSFSRPRLGPDGEVIGFVGVAFDVTDIRETNARLAAIVAERDAILGQLAEGVIITDPGGEILFVNEAARRIHGIAELGVDPSAYALTYGLFTEAGEPYPAEELPLSRAVLKGETVADARWRIRRPDGSEVLAVGNARPVHGADGEAIGAVLTLRDETARIAAEEDLKLLNEQLEDRVGAALAEKAKAEADLMHVQRMEAVGRLTGGVAHDFNNLLTVVIGALDIMLRSDDPKKREKLGQAALSAARRGESLTHQLLAFSRRQALRPQPVDLNAQIAQSEPLLRRALGPHVTFDLDLADGDIAANVDPAQLEAALLNLIVNAGDAVGSDGRVVVSTSRARVDAGATGGLPSGDYVRLTVSDDGAGMPPEVLARVFEPFFTTKAVGKGTGLGLSQVYGFARQSGGDVRIQSTLGRGAAITLWLPALEGAVRQTEAEAVQPTVGGGRVLLVEDDAAVSAVAEELLEELGYEVVCVDGPDAALGALTKDAFDIMLSDVVMPGSISGIELGRLVAERHPSVRIVLTSGYAGEDADRALASAPWPFLRKPYSADELRKVLQAEG